MHRNLQDDAGKVAAEQGGARSACFLRAGTAACLAALLLAACSLPHVSPSLRVGAMDMDGKINIESGGVIQSSADTDELGLDTEAVTQGRIDLDGDAFHLIADGFSTSYSGDGTLSNTFTLGGQSITVNTPVSTDLDLDYYRLQLIYDLVPGEVLDLGIGPGIGYVDYNLRLRSKLAPVTVETSTNFPFTFLGVRAGKAMGDFETVALLGGLGWSTEYQDFSYYDLDVYAGYRLFGKGRVQGKIVAGYRQLVVDYRYHDLGSKAHLDVGLQGPYIGLKVDF